MSSTTQHTHAHLSLSMLFSGAVSSSSSESLSVRSITPALTTHQHSISANKVETNLDSLMQVHHLLDSHCYQAITCQGNKWPQHLLHDIRRAHALTHCMQASKQTNKQFLTFSFHNWFPRSILEEFNIIRTCRGKDFLK